MSTASKLRVDPALPTRNQASRNPGFSCYSGAADGGVPVSAGDSPEATPWQVSETGEHRFWVETERTSTLISGGFLEVEVSRYSWWAKRANNQAATAWSDVSSACTAIWVESNSGPFSVESTPPVSASCVNRLSVVIEDAHAVRRGRPLLRVERTAGSW